MQKSMLIALGILLGMSIAVVMVTDDGVLAAEPSYELYGVDGMGTESDPYLVDSAEDLVIIDSLSSAMSSGTYIYVELVNDIDVSDADVRETGYFINIFRGSFDGNGHSIIGNNADLSFLFYYTVGESLITDVELNTDSVMILVFLNNTGASLTMTDVTVWKDGNNTMDNTNFAPFIAHSFGNVVMERCVNHADMVIGQYGAVFIGGYVWNSSDITFRDCINYGDVTGVNTSLFIGNMNKIQIGTLTVEGCANYGNVVGSTTAMCYFFANAPAGDKAVADRLNELCKTGGSESDLTAGNSAIMSCSIEAVAGEGEFTQNTATTTIDTTTREVTTTSTSATYAVFAIGDYASGNGSWMTYIYDEPVQLTGGKASPGFEIGMITSQALAEVEYGVTKDQAEKTGTTGNGFTWYLYRVNGTAFYAVDFGDTEWTMNDDVSFRLAVTVYSADGVPQGYTHGTITVQKPTVPSSEPSTTYYKVFVVNEGQLNLVCDSRYVASGGSFTFTIVPEDGYVLSDVVSIEAGNNSNKNATGYIPYKCEVQDGKYTIDNITSNVYITIGNTSYSPITYDVVYNLTNVTSTSAVGSLGYEAPFTTTLSPVGGYVINEVTVMMGGVEVRGAYDSETGQVSIRHVTGDVTISASASLASGFDDEDLPPFIPTQPAEEDDTVTIVACAAAAAVAAILAVFLVIDRKG